MINWSELTFSDIQENRPDLAEALEDLASDTWARRFIEEGGEDPPDDGPDLAACFLKLAEAPPPADGGDLAEALRAAAGLPMDDSNK